MAKRGRVIPNSISVSPLMADLGNSDFCLLASWLPLHADDQGRLEADPRRLKGQVAPLLPWITPEVIAVALANMERLGLIIRYQSRGLELLQIIPWWRDNNHQEYTAASEHPPPAGWRDCPPGKGTAARGGYGFGEFRGNSPTVGEFPDKVEQGSAVVAVAVSPSLTTTTATTPTRSGERESEGEGAPPPDALDAAPAADPAVRLAALVPVLEQGGAVFSPLTVAELTLVVQEHPAADEQAAARVLQALIPNLPRGDRVTPAFVGQVLELVAAFPEAEIHAAIAAAPSDRCRPGYVRGTLLGWQEDQRRGDGEPPPVAAKPPWERARLERAAFELKYGPEAVEAGKRWDEQHPPAAISTSGPGRTSRPRSRRGARDSPRGPG